MSIAPTFDLLLEAWTAEEMAKVIVNSDIGMTITLDRSPIKTPGSTGNKKGSPEAVRKEIDLMLTSRRFGRWMADTFGDNVNTPDLQMQSAHECWKTCPQE